MYKVLLITALLASLAHGPCFASDAVSDTTGMRLFRIEQILLNQVKLQQEIQKEAIPGEIFRWMDNLRTEMPTKELLDTRLKPIENDIKELKIEVKGIYSYFIYAPWAVVGLLIAVISYLGKEFFNKKTSPSALAE